jgi:integrase/recombinase XerD
MTGRVSGARIEGPLAACRTGFEQVLTAAGYRPWPIRHQLGLMAHLDRWLGAAGYGPADLTADLASAFLHARREAGYRRLCSPRALRPLLGHLRDIGVVPSEVRTAEAGPLGELVERFRVYLVGERGLASETVYLHIGHARRFLACWLSADGNELHLAGITSAAVTAFVVAESRHRSTADAKHLVSALRALLRFLVLDGAVALDLRGAVPAIPGWRNTALPKGLSASEVDALLRSCDVSSRIGRRDFAILVLLSRLGLRSCEVARLRLEDLDWRHGEFVVHGKASRVERLPIPVDVGEAVAVYLTGDNNRGEAQQVFITSVAPMTALTRQGVCAVVRRAGRRAGLGPIGAHRLRHTVATRMLRAEASLAEVGQVLRHRRADTTAIYAKVDRIALRPLAKAWPGVTA